MICVLFFLASTTQFNFFSTSLAAQPMQNLSAQNGWENTLQNLLKSHGTLLSQVVEAAYYDKPIDPIKRQLLSNARDLASFFTSFLGPHAGKDFEPLFDDHIKLGGEYISAVKQHQPTDRITQQALQNGNQIGDLFSKWFPSIPDTQWRAMMTEHVKLEAQLADAYFNNNLDAGHALINQTLTQLSQLGDLIIQGLKNLKQ